MKRWLITQFGAEHKLEIEDVPTPSPGPGEVLVRLHAWSLNYRDLMILRGEYGQPKHMPLVPLSDGAGEIVALGTNARLYKPGQRVFAAFFQGWLAGPFHAGVYGTDLGFGLPGVLSEYVCLPEQGVADVPAGLSMESAATLPVAGLTAWNAVKDLPTGRTLLVLGTGGVSLFAVQIARSFGNRVIVTSSSDEKLARAKALGADEGVNYVTHPDWDHEVQRLTQGRGADWIVETGGAKTFQRSLNALAPAGRISLVGRLTGVTDNVNIQPLVYKAASLRGIFVGSRIELLEAATMIERAGIQPIIDSRHKFADAPAAWQALAKGPFGKVVITA